jgi:glycerol uptake facilitator-like aquaporin
MQHDVPQQPAAPVFCHMHKAVRLQCAAVFATANISGGHITPTVTIATMITGGHM